jgi:hypothetical protein
MSDIVKRLRSEQNPGLAVRQQAADALERLAAENAALRKDAEARSLYDRTAAAQGFTNAPHWNDLAEETRQMYRDERAKRDAAMGESHAE